MLVLYSISVTMQLRERYDQIGSYSVTLNILGFELLLDFISPEIAESVIEETDSFLLNGKGGGIRNADKKFQSIEKLASSEYLLSEASRYVSGKPSLVRAILFDKSPKNNWLVAWHQDKTIAVSSRFDIEGWGPWSLKDGVHHVQPVLSVLEDMVTFRIHLDESNKKNGCLKVIPKSHSLGLMTQVEVYRHMEEVQAEIVEAPRLSALAMRPHILHASSKAQEPSRRRILHLEYSSYELPSKVVWA